MFVELLVMLLSLAASLLALLAYHTWSIDGGGDGLAAPAPVFDQMWVVDAYTRDLVAVTRRSWRATCCTRSSTNR